MEEKQAYRLKII